MRVILLAWGAITLPIVAAQFPENPPTDAPPDTIEDCTAWVVASDVDTCQSLADYGLITLDEVYAYVRTLLCPFISCPP